MAAFIRGRILLEGGFYSMAAESGFYWRAAFIRVRLVLEGRVYSSTTFI